MLDSQALHMAPSATGTVTDALRGQSFIQFDQNSRNGAQGGEITPPQISIRGSKNYENSFLINGIAGNNLLSPSGWQTPSDSGVIDASQLNFADAQSILLKTDLLESVTVLSENIPAEYGNFTGGVVNSQLRDAKMDRWHATIFARHTRDSWANIHLTEEQSALENPTAYDGVQPKFKKTSGGIILEGPLLEDKLGAVLSYQQDYSSIPVWVKYENGFEETKNSRRLENFMLRLNTREDADFYVAGTLIYSPFQAELDANRTKDGHYSLESGGLNAMINTRANTKYGQWKNDFGWSRTVVNRDADTAVNKTWNYKAGSSYANWLSSTSREIEWGPSGPSLVQKSLAVEGLYGDFDQTQNALNFKSVFDFDALEAGRFTHRFKAGTEINYVKAEGNYGANTQIGGAVDSTTVKGSISDGVIAGEQYLGTRQDYDEKSIDADYLTLAAFVEDTMQVERLMVRAGLRVSYDDITKDTNVAPRLLADFDLANNGKYHFTAGYNRYYGSQILGYAFYADQTGREYKRTENADGTLTDWQYSKDIESQRYQNYDLSKLETPYSDEFALGFSVNTDDGTLISLQGVRRLYKKQLDTKKSGSGQNITWSLTNDGQSEYKGLTLTVEKFFDLGVYGKHGLSFGITRSDLKGSYTDWQNGWQDTSDSYDPQFVYLNGTKVARSEMPANNFNSDWTLTLGYDASLFDDRLKTSLLLRYESAADRLIKDGRGYVQEGGNRVLAYRLASQKALFNADLNVSYDVFKYGEAVFTVEASVLNLFDRNNYVNTSVDGDGTYSMGRQYFLGINCRY